MRSAYTAILDKPSCTFNEFLWRCAKAFSPLYHMRDEDMDKPPTTPPADSYDAIRLAEKEKELAEATKKTPLEWAALAEERYKKDMEYYRKVLSEWEKTTQIFDAMREKVIAWAPPTQDHNGLKVFMLEQLEGSIRFNSKPEEPKLQNWETLRAFEIQFLKDGIAYHKGKIEDNEKSRQKCIKWVADLKASVPLP